MIIQKVNQFSCDRSNSVKKTNYKTPSFKKSYEEVLTNVIKRDLKYSNDVSIAFTDLLNALKSSSGVKISPELAVLESNGFKSIHTFMEKICAPIAKVPSSLRDMVFKAEEESIILLENDKIGSLTMFNLGKKGFLNSLFNSQDAKSDIKFLFSSPRYDTFEIGINKRGQLHVEQVNYPNWIASEFDPQYCISKKTGTYDTCTPIW